MGRVSKVFLILAAAAIFFFFIDRKLISIPFFPIAQETEVSRRVEATLTAIAGKRPLSSPTGTRLAGNAIPTPTSPAIGTPERLESDVPLVPVPAFARKTDQKDWEGGPSTGFVHYNVDPNYHRFGRSISYEYDPQRISAEEVRQFYRSQLPSLGWKFQDEDKDYKDMDILYFLLPDDFRRGYPTLHNNVVFRELRITTDSSLLAEQGLQDSGWYQVVYLEYIPANPAVSEVIQRIKTVMNDTSLSEERKREELKITQRNVGEEMFATAVRNVPIFDPNTRTIRSYDQWLREMTSNLEGNTPFERDPVGATVNLFFNPSEKNIQELLGLSNP